MDKFYVTDCEGPLSINDNAYELSDYFLFDGGRLFSILSHYDDMLVEKNTENYLAGSTLAMILPFFKLQSLTDKDLVDFSMDNINMVNGAYKLIDFIQDTIPSYIVSTSYSQYIQALCNKTGFNYDNTYSTKLSLDAYDLPADEVGAVTYLHENILLDPSFDNLDYIYNNVIPNMKINALVESVTPVGGVGKQDAILDIIDKNNYSPEDLMYSGDSITDKEALEYTKDNGGVAISFNGNIHSIKSASISIASDNNLILGLIAKVFKDSSTSGVEDFVNEYNADPLGTILEYSPDNDMTQDLLLSKPEIDFVRPDNIDLLRKKSETTRNIVRGANIGNLG